MALVCQLQKLSKMRKVSTEMVGDLDRAFLGVIAEDSQITVGGVMKGRCRGVEITEYGQLFRELEL